MPQNHTATAWAFRRHFSEAFDAGEKSFPQHYLLYASSGCFHLELAGRNWLLPTHRAAWIRSGVPVRIWTQGPVTSASVLFTPSPELAFDFDCWVFCVSELARGLLDHCMRWDTEQAAANPKATRMFGALADVCLELSSQADQFWLPRATSKELQRALQFTLQHLGAPLAFADVAAAACVSERTLARRFADEAGMVWRDYLRRARLIAAMESLTNPAEPIAQVAHACGYESLGAFNAAFRAFTGDTPSGYRRRLRAGLSSGTLAGQ
jgi:AraC-like DNA-binding protein